MKIFDEKKHESLFEKFLSVLKKQNKIRYHWITLKRNIYNKFLFIRGKNTIAYLFKSYISYQYRL